ncbi:MAG: diaminopimelate epimerase [Chlamydiales bacterium]|jgi:diaminopimelate epimerase
MELYLTTKNSFKFLGISFSKYSGSGNDFILIDNRKSFFPVDKIKIIQDLCQRRNGIGADGIILLQNSVSADFRMRIFNADGSEAEMCGNGIRCLIKFLLELGFKEGPWYIETMERKLFCKLAGDQVSINMGEPTDFSFNLPLSIDGQLNTVHVLNTGVPHAVIFVEDEEEISIDKTGAMIRYHEHFRPKGVNASFACVRPSGKVFQRTYERGVEGETLACGTGATAVAIAAAKVKKLQPPILVRTRSGSELKIDFKLDGDNIRDVSMTGDAQLVYQGQVEISKTL